MLPTGSLELFLGLKYRTNRVPEDNSLAMLLIVVLMQGHKHTTNGKNAGWPRTPAQEHKFDALAAVDAGQLAEAQHAFDLSVWSDLKTDKGMVTVD